MRLNKKKLAALAMSAVMAASTMPFPVLAEEFTDGNEATVTESQADATKLTVETASIDETTGKVTGKYRNGVPFEDQATETLATKATCTEDATYYWNYKSPVDNSEWGTTPKPKANTKLGHDFKWEYVITAEPDCENKGQGQWKQVCQREGCTATGETKAPEEIAANGHTWGTVKTKYENFSNVDEITHELKDPKFVGSYDIVTYQMCTVAGCTGYKELTKETKVLYPTDVTEYATLVSFTDPEGKVESNIEGIYNGTSVSHVYSLNLKDFDESKVVLSDCSKPGTYWVISMAAGSVLKTVPVTIPAHHHVTKLEGKVKDTKDAALITFSIDENNNLVATNKTCTKSVSYYELAVCQSPKCSEKDSIVSKVERIAAPSDVHKISNTGKKAVSDAQDIVKAKGYLTKDGYATLKRIADDSTNGIKLTRNGGCDAEGTVTVTYVCQACGKETGEPVTMKLGVQGHEWGKNTSENEVEATCGQEGSYDLVHTCTVCGEKEIITAGVKKPATGKHSFKTTKTTTGIDETDAFVKFAGTVVVDINGENLTKKGKTYVARTTPNGFKVSAEAAITCDTCGETYNVHTWNTAIAESLTLTVVDIQKESANGDAGSITLKAEFVKTLADNKKEKVEDTYTVPYFSNMIAYLDRNPAKDPINGLHKDDDDVWRYYENGEFKSDYVGLVEYQGGKFFVANGLICTDAKGLNQNVDKEWYFLAGGQVQIVTGLVGYNGGWFYLTDGKLDRTKSGLVEYNGRKFIVAKGELQRYSGLWQDPADGTWYFAAQGEIQEQYTGTAIYNGKSFELVNGKLVR